MNGNVLFLISTLAAWTGWIAVLRLLYLALVMLLGKMDHLREAQAKAIGQCAAVALVGLSVSQAMPAQPGLDPAHGPALPLVWPMIPFTGWLAIAGVFMAAARVVQAFSALNDAEKKARLGSAAVWAGVAAASWFVFKRTDGEIVIFKGRLPVSVQTIAILACALTASMAAMVASARYTKARGLAKAVTTHLALIVGSFIFGLPFAWLVVTSFKEDRDMVAKEGIVWIPRVQVAVPYDDPQDPRFETQHKGRTVTVAQLETLPNGKIRVEVDRPLGLQGLQFEADKSVLKRVPKEAPVVTALFNGERVKALVAENMNDGRQRLRVMEPARLNGQEFTALPSDTEPVMVIGLRTKNYSEALEFLPPEANRGLTYLRNTLVLVVMTLIGTLLSSALVAYGFSRLRFPGKSWLFMVLLSTMMLPGAVTMLPSFLIFRSLGWIDTLYPLWVPAFFASAFNVFLLKQFFSSIPMELEDAAKIDGCSYLRTFWQVMLPQIKPALAVIAIWTFMGAWNNFMGPLIYISSPEHMPIAYAVQLFQNDRGGEPGLTMAFATMSTVPVLVLFFFAQKYFIEGVQLSGLGGR